MAFVGFMIILSFSSFFQTFTIQILDRFYVIFSMQRVHGTEVATGRVL